MIKSRRAAAGRVPTRRLERDEAGGRAGGKATSRLARGGQRPAKRNDQLLYLAGGGGILLLVVIIAAACGGGGGRRQAAPPVSYGGGPPPVRPLTPAQYQERLAEVRGELAVHPAKVGNPNAWALSRRGPINHYNEGELPRLRRLLSRVRAFPLKRGSDEERMNQVLVAACADAADTAGRLGQEAQKARDYAGYAAKVEELLAEQGARLARAWAEIEGPGAGGAVPASGAPAVTGKQGG